MHHVPQHMRADMLLCKICIRQVTPIDSTAGKLLHAVLKQLLLQTIRIDDVEIIYFGLDQEAQGYIRQPDITHLHAGSTERRVESDF